MRNLFHLLLQGLVLLALSPAATAAESKWIDSISATLGEDKNSNQTDVYRLGLQNHWNRTLFNSGAWYIGGYWDVSLGYLESGVDDSDLYELGITPVLRLQRDADISSGIAPFSEVGIGGHYLTDDKLGKRDFGSQLQLASHVGVGVGFGDKGRYELAYRFQHLTNGGTRSPNNGMEMHLLRFAYGF